jgi:hypothetical protein
MKTAALIVLQTLVAAGAAHAERVPLRWLWHEEHHDSAYTVSDERRDRLVRERGYADMGILAYVDARPSPQGRPLRCVYSGAPRTDTFCSISPVEQRIARALGYVDLGAEGYVEIDRVPNTVALYRVSRAWGDGGDREHRFVISSDELVRLRRQGWTYEGAKGYVYPAP